MRAPWLLSTVLALGCAEETPPGACLRAVATQPRLVTPLENRGVQGMPFTAFLTAPLATCGNTTSAQVEVHAPGNRRVEPANVSGVIIANEEASVGVSLSPDEPGTWRVSVTFEGLGQRSVEVEVMPSRLRPAQPIVVPLGLACVGGPWVFEHGTLAACEQNSAQVAFFPVDGGAPPTLFPGQDLVVAGRVLWMLDETGAALERYVWEDGGPRLTDRWTGFANTALRGVHTEDVAVRASASGALMVRVVDTSGADFTASGFSSSLFDRGVFFTEVNDAGTRVLDTLPRGQLSWVGLEPHVAWLWNMGRPSPNPRPIPMTVGALAPPLPMLGQVAAPSPRAPLVRWPVWVDAADGALSLLAAERPTGIAVVAWPRRTLVRATDEFLIFQLADNSYAFDWY